eukprot:TRINITY_DN641_c1_g2_i1.p1 TRINITY_DN641_c1_g2~~TRINITY_DN641_c1_g2_i1.p1  ORF type:complete len:372 (+),score=74.42 TRINITY_DN641_c1_g2_i1:202-1317(+)
MGNNISLMVQVVAAVCCVTVVILWRTPYLWKRYNTIQNHMLFDKLTNELKFAKTCNAVNRLNVVLIGVPGSGKSSVFNLLLRITRSEEGIKISTANTNSGADHVTVDIEVSKCYLRLNNKTRTIATIGKDDDDDDDDAPLINPYITDLPGLSERNLQKDFKRVNNILIKLFDEYEITQDDLNFLIEPEATPEENEEWRNLVSRQDRKIPKCTFGLFVVPCHKEINPGILSLMEIFRKNKIPMAVVCTYSDQLKPGEKDYIHRQLKSYSRIYMINAKDRKEYENYGEIRNIWRGIIEAYFLDSNNTVNRISDSSRNTKITTTKTTSTPNTTTTTTTTANTNNKPKTTNATSTNTTSTTTTTTEQIYKLNPHF